MRCSECAAELPPGREFCSHCGAPTASGLRRRNSSSPSGRSPEELQSNRKKVLIIGGALLLVLGVGRLSWPTLPIHISVDNDRKGPVVTNAEDLVRAFADDPSGAAKRFGGREIAVSGEFLRIVPDGYGSIDMRLKSPNPDSPLGVDLAGASIEDAKLLRPGQQVTVSCRNVAGSGNDRWLQDCAIQPGGDAVAAPAAPPAPSPPAAPPAPGQGGNSS